MINIMTTLNSYYLEDFRWDRTARSLEIWRKPTADINTPNILRKTLKKAETWQIWPKSKSMLIGGFNEIFIISIQAMFVTFHSDSKTFRKEIFLVKDSTSHVR